MCSASRRPSRSCARWRGRPAPGLRAWARCSLNDLACSMATVCLFPDRSRRSTATAARWATRRLRRDLDAVEEHLRRDRPGEVEALSHRTGRREQTVGLGEVEAAHEAGSHWGSTTPSSRSRSTPSWPCHRRAAGRPGRWPTKRTPGASSSSTRTMVYGTGYAGWTWCSTTVHESRRARAGSRAHRPFQLPQWWQYARGMWRTCVAFVAARGRRARRAGRRRRSRRCRGRRATGRTRGPRSSRAPAGSGRCPGGRGGRRHEAHLGARNLRRRVAADLADPLDDVVHAVDVALGEVPAAGVDRHAAGRARSPAGGEGAALALGAEAVVLELQEHGDREAVVELGDVDVGGTEAGPAVQACRPSAGPAASVIDSRSSTGNWIPGWGLGAGCPGPRRGSSAGGWRRSPARSALVTTTAQAPSVSRQKSKRRSGWRDHAGGEVVVHRQRPVVHLGAPGWRWPGRGRPGRCGRGPSPIVPNSSMWRWASRAKNWPGVSRPYGRKYSS